MLANRLSEAGGGSGRSGAPASYRGYRLQLLYTLERILAAGMPEGFTFQPEDTEDLAIRDASNQLVEIIQVKSYSNLVSSDLSPNDPSSFLHRAIRYLQNEKPPVIRLVNYGSIGPEMHRAWEGVERDRTLVTKKLLADGFSQGSIERLFAQVQLIAKDERSTAHGSGCMAPGRFPATTCRVRVESRAVSYTSYRGDYLGSESQ